MADTTVALIGDHAAFELKTSLKGVLDEHGVQTVGPRAGDDRYRDCGRSHPWLRAAMCYHVTAARLARERNNADGLALGARPVRLEVARDCLLIFLSTPFARGHQARRVAETSSRPQP
jgi:ribose 5-phosphate isomerase B